MATQINDLVKNLTLFFSGENYRQRDDTNKKNKVDYTKYSLEKPRIDIKGTVAENIPTIVLDDQIHPKDVATQMIEVGGQKDPFHLFDVDEVKRRIEYFQAILPRVQIYYAMKCNSNDLLLKLLSTMNVGIDCASPGEIETVRELKVPCRSIIYTMPSKTPQEMLYARESGVTHTTFDCSMELKRLRQHWPEAKLLIRIKIESNSLYKLGEKFGCDFDTEAIDLLEEAANYGLRVIGVAFHVGSACASNDSYDVALRCARALFDREARAGRRMKIVDIGGGFMGSKIEWIDKAAKVINKGLQEYFPDPEIQIIAEPGRYLCESAFTLYCSINNVRQVQKEDKTVNMVYLSDGYHGTLRYCEYWHTVEVFQGSSPNSYSEPSETILWGPTCDSVDRVMADMNVQLPLCSTSDWLVFANQGAYTISLATHFSSIPVTKIRAVVSRSLWEQIKEHASFKKEIFLLNPDISESLPRSIGIPLPKNDFIDISNRPSLVS